MSNPSNLYAEKIYAEHPIALWSLDDKADYISLISEPQRVLSDTTKWNVPTGGEVSDYSDSIDQPFPESQTTKITGDLTENDFGQVVCISKDIENFSTLNQTLSTFSVGGFFNSISAYTSSFEIGYEYDDTTSGSTIQRLKSYTTSIQNRWFFISETFDIPQDNTQFRIVIKINYIGGASNVEDYEFLVNGITVGQWCEEFNSSSLGVQKISIPSTISLPESFAIEADAYGLQDNKGYYMVKDNSLMAKNTGIPLVYGASNLTKLLPNNGLPSIIIPGLGFLSEAGQYKEYTLEAWMRINSDSITKKRILGPIASTDGLYVEGPFIILKVGNNSGAYYVGEWTRPMLIHIRILENNASLLINGEEVISLNYLTSDLTFPVSILNDKEQDWIGFYAYEDVSPIEIDCVAIYTYIVPIVLAKKRFVYGQGVEFPEGINQAYSGSSIYIDYPFADYTNNYSYPNIGKWNQAIVDNLSVENNLLCTPDYKLPEIVLESSNIDQLYSDLGEIQDEPDKFFSFDSVTNGYMYFDNLNFLNERVRSFYGSFKFLEEPTQTQTLFRVESENSSDYFEISTQNKNIVYKLSYGNTEQILATFSWSGEDPFTGIALEEMFPVGLDIDKASKYFGGSVASFFGNINTLKFYIGGRPDLTQTFIIILVM